MAGAGRVLMVAAGCALALPACRSSGARELEAEFGALGVRIDALRNAPNEAKRPLLDALRDAGCRAEALCGLKALCVEAYTIHVSALDASARAKVLLKRPEADTEASLEAAAELKHAEEGLGKAREASERCAREQGRLALEVRGR